MSRLAKSKTKSQSRSSPAAIVISCLLVISTSMSSSDAFLLAASSHYGSSLIVGPGSCGNPAQIATAARPCLPRSRASPLRPLRASGIIDAEVIPDDGGGVGDRRPPDDASNLIEYSQNLDPDWKNMPIAFCDELTNTYVDCNLAFYVKDPTSSGGGLGGIEYALGVPRKIPIVVALEVEDGDVALVGGGGATTAADGDGVVNLSKVVPINPDDDSGGMGGGANMREEEKEEVFQLAARALMGEYGPSIRLKKTPRVLTLEGDLDGVLGDWREVLLGGGRGKRGGNGDKVELSIEDAANVIDEDEDDDDFFDRIMRRDLGDDYESLVDGTDDDIDEELLELFRDSSLGDDDDDEDGVDGLLSDLDSINDKAARFKDTDYDGLVRKLQPSAALKLINFLGPGGREYTILRPLRPILLVGREDPDDYTRRILLTEEERRRILPRLESACREGLEEAGFFLSGT